MASCQAGGAIASKHRPPGRRFASSCRYCPGSDPSRAEPAATAGTFSLDRGGRERGEIRQPGSTGAARLLGGGGLPDSARSNDERPDPGRDHQGKNSRLDHRCPLGLAVEYSAATLLLTPSAQDTHLATSRRRAFHPRSVPCNSLFTSAPFYPRRRWPAGLRLHGTSRRGSARLLNVLAAVCLPHGCIARHFSLWRPDDILHENYVAGAAANRRHACRTRVDCSPANEDNLQTGDCGG